MRKGRSVTVSGLTDAGGQAQVDVLAAWIPLNAHTSGESSRGSRLVLCSLNKDRYLGRRCVDYVPDLDCIEASVICCRPARARDAKRN